MEYWPKYGGENITIKFINKLKRIYCLLIQSYKELWEIAYKLSKQAAGNIGIS